MTTRDFGFDDRYGISVYGLEKNKMVDGDPGARAVQFFLEDRTVPLNLIGDGLLPPDLDGNTKPKNDVPAPIVGTQDDGGGYGATFDALNIWEFDVMAVVADRVDPSEGAAAGRVVRLDLPVCTDRSGLPPATRDYQPRSVSRHPLLSPAPDVAARLSQQGRVRDDGDQPVGRGASGVAGARWYEIRRTGGTYSVYQQGTYAPNDGVHRWMGSIAADKNGNMALGYSVVNGTNVFPGIRYTGRLAGDLLGQMTLGEGTVVNGTASQTHVNSRWGDSHR